MNERSDGGGILMISGGMDVEMSKMQTRRLNSFQRLNRKITFHPLLRTRLIWMGRVWLVSILQFAGVVIESLLKIITKIVLIILAAIFFM